MRIYDIIEKKKRGQVLSKEEITWTIKSYTKGEIPDYQMSALLMAIYFQGMTIEETSDLTLAMAYSGETSDLSKIEGIKVDKHSTGGVGDTTTIVLAPLVAAAGVPVAKMSGRGLGHTGGTIDKLEAIPGFNVSLSPEAFIDHVNTHQIAVVSQTGNLAPADKKIYALRDVTATVDNVSLIAASIMSKKIASGSDAIVLDVKCGSGAFMKTLEEATLLGETMVQIGKHVGRKVIAVITDMSQPLNEAIGNSVEVIEAIEVLKGRGSKDLTTLSETLAANMLVLGGKAKDLEAGLTKVRALIDSGEVLTKLKEWIKLQGGDPKCVDDYSLMPSAKHTFEIFSENEGYVSHIDAELLGKAALVLGAGRENKDSLIDLGAGLKVHRKIGDWVSKSEPLATLYYNDASKEGAAIDFVKKAYTLSKVKTDKPKLIYKMIS